MARRRIAKKQKATKSELREESRKCAGLKIFEEQESLIQEITKQNIDTSPFLRLPSEVRLRIYKMMFGHQLIHLKCWPYGGRVVWNNKGISHDKSTCEELHLELLRSCREIYHEAYDVLWSTNTFYFDNPKIFSKFIRSRKADQAKLIKNLWLCTEIFPGSEGDWNPALMGRRGSYGLRTPALRGPLAQHLRGVQNLHLTIRTNYGASRPRIVQIVKELAKLPLVSAEVSMEANQSHWAFEDISTVYRNLLLGEG